MSVISDAAQLPSLPVPTNNFMDFSNALAVTNEGIQHVQDMQTINQPQQPVFHSIQYKNNSDGGSDVTLSMPQSTLDRIMPLLQTGQAAQAAFAQARQGLFQKRQFLEQHPLVGALGSIASTAAADYAGGPGNRISPIVRAAGAYGLTQFGKTTDQLSQEEAGLAAQQFQIQRQMSSEQQQEALITQGDKRIQQEGEAIKLRAAERQDEIDQRSRNAATEPFEQAAKNGANFDKTAFAKDPEVQRAFKGDAAAIKAKGEALSAIAVGVKQNKQDVIDMNEKAQERELKAKAHEHSIEMAQQAGFQHAALNMGKYSDYDKQISEAYQQSAAAHDFAATIAAQLNVPPPTTREEAMKQMADFQKANPGDPKVVENVKTMAGMLSSWDPSGKIEALQASQKAVFQAIPKDLRSGMYEPGSTLTRAQAAYAKAGLGRPTAAQEAEANKQFAAQDAADAQEKAALAPGLPKGTEGPVRDAPENGPPQRATGVDLYQGGGLAEVPRTPAGTPSPRSQAPTSASPSGSGKIGRTQGQRMTQEALDRWAGKIAELPAGQAQHLISFIRQFPSLVARDMTPEEMDKRISAYLYGAAPDKKP